MITAELAARRECGLGVGQSSSTTNPYTSCAARVCTATMPNGGEISVSTTTCPAWDIATRTSGFHDATLKVRPTPVFGREHTDAFPAAFEEMVREFH